MGGDSRSPTRGHQPELDETVVRAQLDVRAGLRDTSSLPVAMFDACDPMMEAVLAQAAATLFLDQMRLSGEPSFGEPGSQRVEEVSTEEIQALCRQLDAEGSPDTPSLMGDLTRERLWVLMDLVVAGSPGARISAAARLHETIGEILDPAQLDPMLLGQVATLLQEGSLRDHIPEMMRDLLRQASEQGEEGER